MSCVSQCVITEGILSSDCLSSTGGVKRYWLTPYCSYSGSTADADGKITGFTNNGNLTWFEYKSPAETSFWTDIPTPTKENGTLFFTPTINVKVTRFNQDIRNQMLLLAKGYVVAIAENNDGTYTLLGEENGLGLESAESGSGTAFSDSIGATFVLSGKQKEPADEVDSTAITSLVISTSNAA